MFTTTINIKYGEKRSRNVQKYELQRMKYHITKNGRTKCNLPHQHRDVMVLLQAPAHLLLSILNPFQVI
jgi:hypothetical protein